MNTGLVVPLRHTEDVASWKVLVYRARPSSHPPLEKMREDLAETRKVPTIPPLNCTTIELHYSASTTQLDSIKHHGSFSQLNSNTGFYELPTSGTQSIDAIKT